MEKRTLIIVVINRFASEHEQVVFVFFFLFHRYILFFCSPPDIDLYSLYQQMVIKRSRISIWSIARDGRQKNSRLLEPISSYLVSEGAPLKLQENSLLNNFWVVAFFYIWKLVSLLLAHRDTTLKVQTLLYTRAQRSEGYRFRLPLIERLNIFKVIFFLYKRIIRNQPSYFNY